MRRVSIVVTVVFIVLAGSLVADRAAAQRWSWPEEPENLKVLGEEIKGPRLRAVMTGFTRALGVRCSHCHVGEEGQPLSTYDFPSDENPNKDRAREMLRLLGSVNGHLDKIEPSGAERVNMWCHTCHRGRPRPTTLDEELREAYGEDGPRAMRERYSELHERYYGRGTLDFGERTLNGFGYELLGAGDVAGAIAVFRLNVEQFPLSGNGWDSLAEAYLTEGQRELAAIYYRKSLELDPGNRNALDKLRELAVAIEPATP
jgi:tetratricopeptide (TPR) repeat protein